MTKRLSVFIKAYLSAFAITVKFHAPLEMADYEDRLDFIIASVYELLGEYQFSLLLVFGLCCFLYWHMERAGCGKRESGFSLTAVFLRLRCFWATAVLRPGPGNTASAAWSILSKLLSLSWDISFYSAYAWEKRISGFRDIPL